MLHGTYHFGRKRVACRNAYCTNCRAPHLAEGLKSVVVWHLCFIPLLPIGMTVRWFCSTCRKQIDSRRPSRPWILVAGVLFGLLLTFVGIMVLIDGQDRETAWGCLGFGLLMVAGLIYMLRKQDYRTYLVSREAVPPLSGDHCPYCQAPVFQADKPHCHSCRVDIITGAG